MARTPEPSTLIGHLTASVPGMYLTGMYFLAQVVQPLATSMETDTWTSASKGRWGLAYSFSPTGFSTAPHTISDLAQLDYPLMMEMLDSIRKRSRASGLTDVLGLHKTGVIYRNVTIDAFRLGILNHHIGMLPAYRGRSVLEWSILQGDPVGITMFFIDADIDTGSRILFAKEVDVSSFRSIAEAKHHLFDLDREFFRRALVLLCDSTPSFRLNDASGRRYFVMSKLFQEVVDRLLQTKTIGGPADN